MITDEHSGQELPWSAFISPASFEFKTEGGAIIRFPPNQSFTMKPHVIRFANDLEAALGMKMNFGTYAGHSPPEGPTQALDIFNQVTQAGWALQDRICKFFIDNVGKYGGRYCIRRVQIWNVERKGEGWRNQSRTGNPTVDHEDHVHVTFYSKAQEVDDMFEADDRKKLYEVVEAVNNPEVGMLRRLADVQRAMQEGNRVNDERFERIMRELHELGGKDGD